MLQKKIPLFINLFFVISNAFDRNVNIIFGYFRVNKYYNFGRKATLVIRYILGWIQRVCLHTQPVKNVNHAFGAGIKVIILHFKSIDQNNIINFKK